MRHGIPTCFLRLVPANPLIIVSSLPVVFSGFLMALAIVLVAFPLAIPFGFILSLMRISNSRILHGISGFYINIIRGTPAFLQIYIAFFGLPLAGVNIGNYPLGVIVMAMNSAAYLCEIFRAGIQSIPPGQNEAARSLGMNRMQTMLYVVVPQTFRNVLPTLTSEFILLYKDTSLARRRGCDGDRHVCQDDCRHHRLHHSVCGGGSVLPAGYPAAYARGERSGEQACG